MGKRGNENAQMRREEWEAAEARGDDVGEDKAAGTFDKANEVTIAKRRIIKVGRSAKWASKTVSAGSETGGAVPVAPPPPPSSSLPGAGKGGPGKSNVAVGFDGFSAAAMPVQTEAANPFAGVAFAGASGAGRAPLTSVVTGSFAASGSTTKSRPPNPSADRLRERAEFLNRRFLKMITQNGDINPMSDWTDWVREYVTHAKDIAKEHRQGQDGGEDGQIMSPSALPTKFSPGPTASDATSLHAPSAKLQAPSAKSFSSEAPSPAASGSFSGFSFGGSGGSELASAPSQASTASKPLTGFSFGKGVAAPPGPTPVPVPAPALSAETGDDAEVKDEVEAVEQEKNEDENTLYEVKAKYFKAEADGKWKPYSGGVLRLYRHKTDVSRMRMVLRNETGRVQLNLAVTKGMKFTKPESKKKGVGHVSFIAVQDEKKGVEKFLLKVKLENLEKLVETLEKMAR